MGDTFYWRLCNDAISNIVCLRELGGVIMKNVISFPGPNVNVIDAVKMLMEKGLGRNEAVLVTMAEYTRTHPDEPASVIGTIWLMLYIEFLQNDIQKNSINKSKK